MAIPLKEAAQHRGNVSFLASHHDLRKLFFIGKLKQPRAGLPEEFRKFGGDVPKHPPRIVMIFSLLFIWIQPKELLHAGREISKQYRVLVSEIDADELSPVPLF